MRTEPKARRIPQENVVKQTRVGGSATYTYDLHKEEDIYNEVPYFEVSEKSMHIYKNTELFSPLSPFCGPNDVQAPKGT